MTAVQPRDNTRSTMFVIIAIALALGLIAALFGLSDKPEVSQLSMAADQAAAFGSGSTAGEAEPELTEVADSPVPLMTETPVEAAPAVAEPTPTPTSEPTPTPDLAVEAQAALAQAPTATAVPQPAVAEADATAPAEGEPAAATAETDPDSSEADGASGAIQDPATAAPEAEDTAADTDADAAASSALVPAVGDRPVGPVAGTMVGSFFTRPDEEAGAVVTANEILITIETDGTGILRAVLEMTDSDGATISILADAPFEWTTLTPQVALTIPGTYLLNSPDDVVDTRTEELELTITNIGSGSGSICTPRCFGFTFG